MILNGKLYAESPIYRGNARKTLFTRDGDGTQRLVSLAGEINGTAQSLMDAFVGSSRDGRNIGLLNRLWERLYGSPLPKDFITKVDCKLQTEGYPRDHFFDLRMGIRLDEDRAAAEANANYKYETLFRNSVFDFSMEVNDKVMQQGENAARLYYMLKELTAGRFWFGAGKSKGLGHCRLEMKTPLSAPSSLPSLNTHANHLQVSLAFDAVNPVLVGWNWGKVDPGTPSFAAIEGRMLVAAMRNIPDPIRTRLERGLAGPILNPEDWKRKLTALLPKVIAIWLQENSAGQAETWSIPSAAIAKMSKGKYPLAKNVVQSIQPLLDQSFPNLKALEYELDKALGEKMANMFDRILKVAQSKKQATRELNQQTWLEIAGGFGLESVPGEGISANIQDEAALTLTITEVLKPVMSRLYDQVDQQTRLIQSDSWVDVELASRQEHLNIKKMLLAGKISESQWIDRNRPPEGVSNQAWREFLEAHRQVQYQHILNDRNLRKSIANDENFIAFITSYRDKTRQELSQPDHVDFRAGGLGNREISKKYGKPYDTVFMRMLSWSPAPQNDGKWTIYIPGSTIKGAFRKRASQVLKTLWGETGRTEKVLDRLFGKQRQRGLILFSDAYLMEPSTPERYWCAMDGVRMDPKTAAPVEQAKSDYLFAYGNQLKFQLQLDLQDVNEYDWESLVVLRHLLVDFQNGDIPVGGEKTSGFGWVKAQVAGLTWLAGQSSEVGKALFGAQPLVEDGLWQKLELAGEAAASIFKTSESLETKVKITSEPPRSAAGFISHRSFGGYCGTLVVEAEILTPTCVRESGEPSFKAESPEGPVNGWDSFSMSPAETALRDARQKVYALPSKSLRGMLRHIYTIASDSSAPSPDITRLNPADSLFGWVGNGPNQALMSRLSIGFGEFEDAKLGWFKVPYPYGHWRYLDGKWEKFTEGSARTQVIDKNWRVFPHVPLAPIVKQMETFQPDNVQAGYFRAVLPGALARFSLRFWNLTQEELQRLVWCLAFDGDMAHKIGSGRYLGFGSLRLRILPESFLIDWESRYAGKPEKEWQTPIQVEQWINPKVILHYNALRQALNVK